MNGMHIVFPRKQPCKLSFCFESPEDKKPAVQNSHVNTGREYHEKAALSS